MKANIARAVLLAAPGRPLQVTADANRTKIRLPAKLPDPIATVIRLDLQGPLVVDHDG